MISDGIVSPPSIHAPNYTENQTNGLTFAQTHSRANEPTTDRARAQKKEREKERWKNVQDENDTMNPAALLPSMNSGSNHNSMMMNGARTLPVWNTNHNNHSMDTG